MPALTPAVFVKSGAGAIVLANRAWASGEKMVPTLADASANVTTARKWVWECTTTGTSTGTPTWPASVTQDSTTVTQNGVVWTARKPGFSSGSTVNWAFATIYIWYGALAAAAGELIGVSNNHAESTANFAFTIPFNGTIGSPSYIACISDAITSGFSYTTGASITTTAASSISINGSFYWRGIDIANGTGATGGNIVFDNTSATWSWQIFDTVNFNLPGTAAGGNNLTASASSQTTPKKLTFITCGFKFGGSVHRFNLHGCEVEIVGGSWTSGGTTPAAIFSSGSNFGAKLTIIGFDCSNLSTTFTFLGALTGIVQFRGYGCKLPASWTGTIFQTTPPIGAGAYGELIRCNSGAVNYSYRYEDGFGTITDNETVVRTGGASDGTTSYSLKCIANANAAQPWFTLATPPLLTWNSTTGVAKTVTVYFILNDATAAKDDEVFVNVDALTNASYPSAARSNDGKASVFAAAATQTTNTQAWDGSVTARANSTVYASGDAIKLASNPGRVFFCTTGGTTAGSEPGGYASAVDGDSVTDNTAVFRAGWRQEASVSITPQMASHFSARMHIIRPSVSFFVGPKAVVA